MLVDLTEAYDTVWHRGVTCKLLQLLPDRHKVRMIMELVGNRNITLLLVANKRNSLRRLKNGIPHGSVLVLLGATTLRTATLALVISTADTTLLPGAVVLTPVSSTLLSTMPCQLWLDACVLHQPIIFVSSREYNRRVAGNFNRG